MKTKKILELAFLALLVAFLIKGVLSDFGYMQPFKPDEVYKFSYMGMAMSSYMFFGKYFFNEYSDKK